PRIPPAVVPSIRVAGWRSNDAERRFHSRASSHPVTWCGAIWRSESRMTQVSSRARRAALVLLLCLPAARTWAQTPMASVNGQTIYSDTVELLGSAYLAQLRQHYGQRYTPEIEHDALQQVLDQVVSATLLMQEAERRGITANESTIDSAVAANDYF